MRCIRCFLSANLHHIKDNTFPEAVKQKFPPAERGTLNKASEEMIRTNEGVVIMFRASELIDIAVRMEQNGRELYRAMAAAAAGAELRNLLENLALAEEQHIADFRRLGEQFEHYAAAETYPGEYDAYVNVLVNSNVFAGNLDPGKLLADCPTDGAILDLAINFEKETLLFLQTFRQVTFSPHGQEALAALTAQEQGHLVKLAALKDRGTDNG